ncbi:topoisomerase C-terminal repeat-containing protein [Bacteroides fragilis]|uniref:type IA DNA topoisomerase n=1 Tax=Bacteroides fragilis TaxID=817 RepID=UPI00202EDA8D|nr:type IA DNA topoisomerase [Bacteroides fragilis]MCM0340277.1 topoisomerase C-terminal repeat-containing protein [Bacteroides fragilis]
MLPIIPDPFKLVVRQVKTEEGYKADPSALKQLDVIRKLLNQTDSVIICTDAAREGELIARYVLEYLGYTQETKRLWISSLTEKSIREGFNNLKSSGEFDNLYRSAKARREADFVIGINASLALSMAAGKSNYSLGRVQTPTLAMICRRYLANRDFVAKPYYQLQLRTTKAGEELVMTCAEKYDTPQKLDMARKKVYEEKTAKVVQVEKKQVSEEAPLLYDLTALQQSANTKLGLTAEQTLNIAQKLYEFGYISYPRTGSGYITEDIFEQVPSLIALLRQHPRFARHAENLCNRTLNHHCVNDSKMTDHHGLMITENFPQNLSLDEQNIYSMIAGRMLEAFSDKCLKETLSVQTYCNEVSFGIKGCQINVPGWRGIYNEPGEKEEESFLPEFKEGETLPVLSIDTLARKTKPQPIFTEASLLASMEGCGRQLSDEKEKEAMKDSGLGTPATRAGIIELLLARHYVERSGRSLIPTPKGLEVYDIVKEKMIANVSMTGRWECALHEIETGKVPTETFTGSINSYARQITSELLAMKLDHPDLPRCKCPKCGEGTVTIYNKVAKCNDPDCGFLLFRTFNGRELTDNQMLLLLQGKHTGYLKFTSKKGKKYEASLELDDNYKIDITFKDNKPKK